MNLSHWSSIRIYRANRFQMTNIVRDAQLLLDFSANTIIDSHYRRHSHAESPTRMTIKIRNMSAESYGTLPMQPGFPAELGASIPQNTIAAENQHIRYDLLNLRILLRLST